MTRRGLYILLAVILVGCVLCVLCPYVEFAFDWNESIFTTGYDGESTIAAIAFLLILAILIAGLPADFVPNSAASEPLIDSHVTSGAALNSISSIPESSPPLPLRI